MIDVNIIRKPRPFLQEEATEDLLFGLVRSHLHYWGQLSHIKDSKIRVLQTSRYNSATEALQRLLWLPITARIKFKIVAFTHKCIYG